MANIHPTAQVHPSAVVAPGAHIGENVQIAPYAVIEDDVHIGPDCRIGSFAYISQYTRMGRGNQIFHHASVGGAPQDLKFHGEVSWLEIGDNNRIREFSTMHRGTESGGGITRVGSNCLIMAYVHVAHDCKVGNSVVMSNNATLGGHVEVGDFAILGGLSAVHQFCRVGHHAFLGGASGIGQDLPPFMLASGHRAKVIGPNLVGLRRLGISPELMHALKTAYRLVWHADMPRKDALEQLEKDYANLPELLDFVSFVRGAERGIVAAGRDSEDL